MMAVNETELTLVQTDGRSFKSVDTPHPITEIVWFASGDKVVFVTQDSSEQIGGSTLGIKHGLWLYELGTFDAVPLGFYDEDFHEVGVSANGRYLSLIAGSGYGDACGIDRAFYIMQLNDAGQRTNLYELAQFNGIPTEVGGFGLGLYPLDNGNWVDGEKVAVQLNALCVFDENGEVADDPALGIYELDVPALQAKRIGDLPAQE